MTYRRVSSVEDVDFEKMNGLVPVVVVDRNAIGRAAVRMVAYANQEALDQTMNLRQGVFYSRSQGGLWLKGKTSGNTLDLVDIYTDCDRDALIYRVRPSGATCHNGVDSCFEVPDIGE